MIYPDHQEWYLRVDSSSCENNDVLEIKNASILIDKIVLKRDYFINMITKYNKESALGFSGGDFCFN
jgi:hypothetical protein